MAETYEEWEARLTAWLASLPPDDPRHDMDPIDQCVQFSMRVTDEDLKREMRAIVENLTNT